MTSSAFGSPAAKRTRTQKDAELGGTEARLPFFPTLLGLRPDQVRQRRIGIQAERLAWQVALKLDAPQVRQASHTDPLDQECQRHVGDRRQGGHAAHRHPALLGRGQTAVR